MKYKFEIDKNSFYHIHTTLKRGEKWWVISHTSDTHYYIDLKFYKTKKEAYEGLNELLTNDLKKYYKLVNHTSLQLINVNSCLNEIEGKNEKKTNKK